MILIVVLVVIGVLTLAGLTFSELMMAEREAAELSARRTQARALANSGVEAIRLFLMKSEDEMLDAGGWYNNEVFRGSLVVDDTDARKRGRFTVVSPYFEDATSSGIRFGLADDSTRFNVNTLALLVATDQDVGREMLMNLPGMTEEIADAILDWIDEDDEPREFGAELDYYSALDPPYSPKNGLLETIEELLLVRDVTPWLLFGTDTNRNGLIDSGESDPQMIANVDNTDGSMNCGWAAYLTLYSQESNLRSDGKPKININQEDLEKLYDELLEVLDENWANFIVGYRQNSSPADKSLAKAPDSGRLDLSGGKTDGGTSSTGSGGGGTGGGGTGGGGTGGGGTGGGRTGSSGTGGGGTGSSGTGGGGTGSTGTGGGGTGSTGTGGGGTGSGGTGSGGTGSTGSSGGGAFQTVLDLIGLDPVEVIYEGQQTSFQLECPFKNDPVAMSSYLPDLMENVTTIDGAIVGRININQAPELILLGIPGFTPTIVEEILGNRISDPFLPDSSPPSDETWILTQGIVTLDEMKEAEMLTYICAGGSSRRGQIIGYFDGGGPSIRVEVVLDTTKQPPTVLFWRDMSHLGRGYALETLGTEAGADW